MEIVVTPAKRAKQSFSRYRGPVLAVLFYSSKQTSKREMIRKVICSRDLIPVHWGQPHGLCCLDPCMAATDCEGLVMGLAALSQLLGSKGQSLGISGGISGGRSDC